MGMSRARASGASRGSGVLRKYINISGCEPLFVILEVYLKQTLGITKFLTRSALFLRCGAWYNNGGLSQSGKTDIVMEGHMKRNALVAQSGGPSPVINASLLGVVEACRQYPDRIGNVYAAWHGIEGVLLEELIDMGAQDEAELKRLKHTPCAGSIGTCRYKLKEGQEADFQRIVDVLRAHDIGYFFYIGGNDSMDTADKVSKLAASEG